MLSHIIIYFWRLNLSFCLTLLVWLVSKKKSKYSNDEISQQVVTTWKKNRSHFTFMIGRCYTFSISLKCLATLPSMFSSRGSCSVCCPETCHSLQIFFQIFHVLKKLPSRTKKIVILDFFKCKYITFL